MATQRASTMVCFLMTAFAGLWTCSADSTASCETIVGKWRWFIGGEVTIRPDGTFVQQSGNSGMWECTDSSKGMVTLRWRNGGYVNKMMLSSDAASLSSTDPSQKFVTATRINPESQLSALLQGKKGSVATPGVADTPHTSSAPSPPKPAALIDSKTEAVFQRGVPFLC